MSQVKLLTETNASATYSALGVPAGVQALTASGKTANAKAATALQGWYARLAQRDTARADVVILGDSLTNGQGATQIGRRYTTRTATRLRQRLGLTAGGVGYISASNTGESTFTWPAAAAGGTAPSQNTDYGVNRYITFLGSSGQAITFTVTGDSVDIMSYNNAGVFSYSVDGGAATNIPGTSGVEVVTHVSLGSAGSHTVTLAWVSGSVFIDGLVVYNGDYTAGVHVHAGGHYGWSTVEWTGGGTGSTQWPGAIAALTPDLIGIELGLNDITYPTTSADFQTNLANLIGYIRAGITDPDPPIVLIAMPARQSTAATWPAYVDAMYAVAAADSKVLVCDLGQRVPGYDADAWSLYYDGVHPNDAGHALIADALTEFLLPG